MSSELAGVRRVAHRLLRTHSGNSAPTGAPAGADAVFERLSDRLSPLLGAGGYEMLLIRATRRARQGHPVLESLEGALHAGEGMREWASSSVARGGAENTAAAAESLLTELIGLIARFLGADMAIRLVRQAFPELVLEGLESGPEESKDE